jgi:hypothetical protein
MAQSPSLLDFHPKAPTSQLPGVTENLQRILSAIAMPIGEVRAPEEPAHFRHERIDSLKAFSKSLALRRRVLRESE